MTDELDFMQESLPTEYSDRCSDIQSILGLAIRKLITEANESSLLEKPFGREKEPQPVMTEEEFMKTKDDLNDDPEFKFEYGFNPLRRLADYVRRFHPENVIARREERENCIKQLSARASHAKRQMRSVRDLHMISSNSLGGILYGPYVMVLSSTSAVVMCRAVEPNSIIVLDVSYDDTFTSCISSQESIAEIDKGLVITFSLTSLKKGCKFYVRCHLKQDESAEGIEALVDTASNEEKGVEESVSEAGAIEGETTEISAIEGANEGETTKKVEIIPKENKIKTSGKITANHHSTFWTFPSTDPLPFPATPEVAANGNSSVDNVEGVAVDVDAVAPNEEVSTVNIDTNPEEIGKDSLARGSIEEVAEDSGSQVSQTPPILQNAVTFLGLSPGRGRYSMRPDAALHDMISSPDEMCFTCLLGDVYPMASPQDVNDIEWYKTRSAAYFLKESYLMDSKAPARSSGLLVAWNDSQIGSDLALQAEEIVYKQYQHDLRHWKKKYKNDKQSGSSKKKSSKHQKEVPPEPTLNRPPISTSLNALTTVLPVPIYEEATRHTYRTFYIGSQIQVFSLDLRRGCLGKAQAKWLTSGLVKSSCAWKIVLAGASFGIINDMEEVSDGVDTADASSTEIPVDGTVNTIEGDIKVVQIAPEANKSQEKGEFGFSTISIEHVMCHVQALLLDRKEKEAAEAAAAEAEAESAAGANGESNGDENIEVNDNVVQNENTSGSRESSMVTEMNKESDSTSVTEEVINNEPSTSSSTSTTASSFIESGIVLLTGGSPTAYVTSIDPLAVGDIFAVEVGTGITGATTEATDAINLESSSSVKINEDLNVSLLYAMTEGKGPSMGMIRVSPTGALQVSIVDAVDSTTKYSRQFRTSIEFDI